MEAARRVLIVDDDRELLAIMRYGLESYGYTVMTRQNAADALQTAMTEAYEYIITDYDMPGMNGIELTRQLRERHSRSVIIGMSGKDLNVAFLEAGANDFVQKPFVPHHLAMMIEGGDLEA